MFEEYGFWDVTPCCSIQIENLILKMDKVGFSETLVNVLTRLRIVTLQKIAFFILRIYFSLYKPLGINI
jgi:hypothetical protein